MKILRNIQFSSLIFRSLCLLVLATVTFSTSAAALPADQKQLIENNIPYYDIREAQICANSSGALGDPSLIGSENAEIAYNYMRGNDLSPMHAAAVIGNLMWESGVMPERIQGSPIRLSKDPNDAGSLGWGIMQWTPATKIFGLMEQAGITTPVYELGSQLQLEWWHMTNIAPPGGRNILPGFKATTTLEDATKYYMDKMEAPKAATAALNKRIEYARAALAKYGEGTVDSTQPIPSAGGGGCGPSSAGAPGATGPCTGNGDMVGNEAILACARLFDPYGYLWGGGHEDPEQFMRKFNATGGFSQPFKQVVDCSGLEMVAIYLAFGVKITPYSTRSIQTVKEFREIPVSQSKPGDILWRQGHTEIAVTDGGTRTFGAKSAKKPPADQIAETKSSGYTKAYTYIGKGSTRQ